MGLSRKVEKTTLKVAIALVLTYFILVTLNILLCTWVVSPWNIMDLVDGMTFLGSFAFGLPVVVCWILLAAIVAGLVWCCYQVANYMLRRWV